MRNKKGLLYILLAAVRAILLGGIYVTMISTG